MIYMADYRVLREDMNIRSAALTKALANVTPDDKFDVMEAAREGMRRMGDLKEPEAEEEGTPNTQLRATIQELRESIA